MSAGYESYNTNGSISHSATGSYGVFTAQYLVPGVGPGNGATNVYVTIPGIYQRWLAGRTIVFVIGSGGGFTYDPAPNDTVSVYNYNSAHVMVMEW